MLITRRRALISGVAGLLIPVVAKGGGDDYLPLFSEVPNGQYPGDFGYMHDKYHPQYQAVFGVNLECSCGEGDCRGARGVGRVRAAGLALGASWQTSVDLRHDDQ